MLQGLKINKNSLQPVKTWHAWDDIDSYLQLSCFVRKVKSNRQHIWQDIRSYSILNAY